MKKLLAFTAFWVFCLGFSQNIDYADRMEHIFGNIDKAKVTTGYLKEFGIRFNEMEVYNGVLDTINWTDKTQWHSLYSSLYTMRVGTAAASMTAPGTVANYLKTQQAGTSDILFAVQHYNYQQYKADAYANGDVTVVNERIYDVTGRNPYDTKRVFAVAPLKHYLEGNTFSFRLPSAMIYGNTGLTPSQIQVDFGNGHGYQTIVPDTAISVSYLSGGEKEIKVKFVYSSGSSKGAVYYSHSRIYIDYIAPNFQARFNSMNLLYDEHPITGYSWQGSAATGYVTVELAPGHIQLTKPLIVVEGFDPDNSFNYNSLINRNYSGGINVDINTNLTLNQAIEDEGYDLVFINFANSTDYIQRNAYMVEKVIEWVNSIKTGNEQNVVMGMSMGGLVARYALRNMEINSKIHDTKLYISHDAPHQGANVPVAFQAMVRHLVGEGITLPVFLSIFDVHIIDLADMLPELEDGLAILQTPAAQQMLIYQLQGTGTGTSVNNNTLYHSFATEYKNMGYPQQGGIRNIAIANGSECGTTLDFNPYANLVNINYKTDFYRMSVIINYLSLNPIKFLASVFSTNTDFKAEFNLKALPNKQSKQIYRGRVYVKKSVLGFINSEDTIINLKTLNSTSEMLPLDNSGGGIYNIDTFVDLPQQMNEYILQRNFNFIPTYSSLDIGEGLDPVFYSDLVKAYSPLSPPSSPRNIPFDNFFTNPATSEKHIQFTLNNGNWILEELRGNTAFYSCASACTAVNLPLIIYGGVDQLCNNATENYTLLGLNPDSNATVNWSVIPTGAVSNIVSNGNSVTITSSGNLNGWGVLQASISTNCGYRNIGKTIYFGAQRPRHLDEYGEEILHIEECTLHHYYAIFETPPGTLEWEWRKISGSYTFSASSNQVIIHSVQPTSGIFDVRVRDACGWSPRTMITVNITNCLGGGYLYTTYPNPATNVLNVAEIPISESQTVSLFNITELQSSSATLYDFNGNQVGYISPASGSMNTESLPSGQYILVIQYGSQSETHHIIIQ